MGSPMAEAAFSGQKHTPVNPCAVFLMLASSIGLRLDAFEHRVIFEQPTLPEDLDEVAIHDLAVGDRTVDLVIYRRAGKVAVAVARNEGGVQVQIVP
jgi:hypothetical protein